MFQQSNLECSAAGGGALKMEDRKSRTGICRTNISENAGPENGGLEFEGPSRRSNGIVCSEVV